MLRDEPLESAPARYAGHSEHCDADAPDLRASRLGLASLGRLSLQGVLRVLRDSGELVWRASARC